MVYICLSNNDNMQIPSLITILLLASPMLKAQFSGHYTCRFNNDDMELTLNQEGKLVDGQLKDSKQTYDINGTAENGKFEAKAVDRTYGITFVLTGIQSNGNLSVDFDLEIQGKRQDAFVLNFIKEGKPNSDLSKSNNVKPDKISNKSIPPAIVGLWKHENNYSSGYGADAMSGTTTNYLGLNADGTMYSTDGQATISGSDYYGQSGQNQQTTIIPNVWFYTENNRLILYSLANGVEEVQNLGTYYIENGNMLLTGDNGVKMLLTKVK